MQHVWIAQTDIGDERSFIRHIHCGTSGPFLHGWCEARLTSAKIDLAALLVSLVFLLPRSMSRIPTPVCCRRTGKSNFAVRGCLPDPWASQRRADRSWHIALIA